MGRKAVYSCLTAVKNAFSPTSNNSGKKPEVYEKCLQKREKRKWSFLKSQSHEQQVQVKPPSPEKMAAGVAEDARTMVVQFTTQPVSLWVLPREYYAAVIIQTVFRGYLARRALLALKGLVTLQALVRGRNVRRKTSMILQSMQAMVRVQHSPPQVAAPCNGHKSSLSCGDNFWDSRYRKDVRRHCPRRLEQIQATFYSRKDGALKREEADSYAVSYQNRRSDCNLYHKKEEPPEMTWVDQWMASRTSICNRTRGRISGDLSSPIHPSPATPSPSIAALSPRLLSKTPSTPNYMAATESAMARLRSRSLQRRSPERERPATARKRLSFPAPEAHCRDSVWSPMRYGMMRRQMSLVSSSVTESLGGEISPTSTRDLRRWSRRGEVVGTSPTCIVVAADG